MTKYVETFLVHLAAIAAALTTIANAMSKGTVTKTATVGDVSATTTEPAKTEAPAGPTKAELKAAKAKEKAEAKAQAKADAAKAETPPAETPPAEMPPAEGQATRADLRKIGSELVSNGKKTEFLAVLANYGSANITGLADHEIDVVLTDLENLLGKKLSEIAD